MDDFIAYADLPRPDDTGQPLAWGVWGADDQIGTLNHITDAVTRAAAGGVRRGRRFNLDLPLHLPYGLVTEGAFMSRGAPRHTLLEQNHRTLYVRDDKLDDFYLQGSSQWDGLTHIGTPQLGFYNGVEPEQVTGGAGSRNGIDRVARFGIATRGVLVDLPRYFAHTGREWSPSRTDVASADDVAACLAFQGVETSPGDILLFRFGWLEGFLGEPDPEARNRWFKDFTIAGLAGDQAMWEFLWDRRIAAAAGDNPTLEAAPIPRQDNLHQAIPRLGFTIGELFDLAALADDCAADGVYTFLLTSSPLNLRGGVGSPPNAMAIK